MGSSTSPRGIGWRPVSFVLAAVASLQLGAALAKGLFDDAGPAGAASLRLGIAAIVLLAIWRPSPRKLARQAPWATLLYGVSLAGMNLCVYEAFARIPLGLAVTLEFVGPLGVAVAGSRRGVDFAWIGLAAVGIALLSGGGELDAAGVAFALVAGGWWAVYIVAGGKVARAVPGGAGLAAAMGIGALVVAPFGIAGGGGALLAPGVLALGAGVALLSSVVPYSLELDALRSMPARVFGVLMSLEPAVAALMGWLVLSEGLAWRELAAIALVVAASAGAASERRPVVLDA